MIKETTYECIYCGREYTEDEVMDLDYMCQCGCIEVMENNTYRNYELKRVHNKINNVDLILEYKR